MSLEQEIQKVCDKLSNGDLLLFEGSSFNAKLIKFFTDHEMSHAAIVYVCPITGQKYIWESGDNPDDCFPIVIRGNKPTNAAHLLPLEVWLRGRGPKKLYVRKLVCKKGKKLDEKKLDLFVAKHLGKLYMRNMVSLWTQRSGVNIINLPFIEDESEFNEDHEYTDWNCSQLVILTYYHLGIAKLDGYSHTVTPGDLYDEIATNPGYDFLPPELAFSK